MLLFTKYRHTSMQTHTVHNFIVKKGLAIKTIFEFFKNYKPGYVFTNYKPASHLEIV